jgi:glycine hydroxymethyltransferase
MTLAKRPWVPAHAETLVQTYAARTAATTSAALIDRLEALAEENKRIHDLECFNLNPATNVMNPRAEALLSSGLGTRPSLGYPGDKYEMGLEAIEEIEVIAAELAAEVFQAKYAEIRVGSGALANLYAFMATCQPGDTIIAPPPTIGGHVTHHLAGCAGLYGLKTVAAPINSDGYTIDIEALSALTEQVKPRLITLGGSLNLFEHPVAETRAIADKVGAHLLFDAAHQCGIIAGGAWKNPLAEGAHLMTMSTYKSLGGPPSGLILTNEADLAQRLDAIAFPGMTANFDVAKSAALAVSLLDWREHGKAYADAMVALSRALAEALSAKGLKIFATEQGFTRSHQFAIEAAPFGGGQAASHKLRKAGFLACGIGLPIPEVAGDLNGLRIGTPELVRRGVGLEHVDQLASLIAEGLTGNDPASVAPRTATFRAAFTGINFIA